MDARPLESHEQTLESIWRLLVSLGMLLALSAGAVLAVFAVWLGATRLLVGTAAALIALQAFLASLYFIADRCRAKGGAFGLATSFGLVVFCAAFFISDAQPLLAIPLAWALAFGWCSARYREIGKELRDEALATLRFPDGMAPPAVDPFDDTSEGELMPLG